MKIWKNVILVTLITALLLVTLCSCNNSGTTQSQQETTTAATTKTEATTEPPPRVFEITVANTHQVIPNDAPVKQLVEERLAELGLNVNITFSQIGIDSATYAQNLALLLAAQDMPDIFQSDGMIDPNTIRGAAAELTIDDFKSNMPDMWLRGTELAGGEEEFSKQLNAKYSISVDAENLDDTYIVRVPYVSLGYIVPQQTGINIRLLNSLGITKIPESIDELESACAAYKDVYPDQYPINTAAGNFMWACFPEFMGAYGIAFLVPYYLVDGELVSLWQTYNLKYVTAKLHDYYEKGYINPEFVTTQYPAIVAQFNEGEIFTSTLWCGDWWNLNPNNPSGLEATVKETIPDAKFGVMKFLKSELYPEVQPTSFGWIPFTGNGVYIYKKVKTEDPEKFAACLQYLNYINYDKDAYILSTFGIEGQHWDYDSDGIVIPYEDYSGSAENLDKGRVLGFAKNYYMQSDIGMGISEEWIRTKAYQNAYQENLAFIDWNEQTYLTKFLLSIYDGAVTDPDGAVIQTQDLVAEQNNWYQFITGSMSMDNWDSWVNDTLGDLGLDALTEAANRLFLQKAKDFYGDAGNAGVEKIIK